MNLSIPDSVLAIQGCRQWIPLLTQQLRLRHLQQVSVYNVSSRSSGSFYYTLHLTTMCAPFYTSEKSNSCNPKWKELDAESFTTPSVSAFVIRIWEVRQNETDLVVLTWIINLSGLVYLGGKLSEVQPDSFNENSVIFYLRGGYFTSYVSLRTDLPRPLQFIDNVNVLSDESETKVFRVTTTKSCKSEIKCSYTVSKLQKLHLLQLNIKNQSLDVQSLRDKIISKCGLCNSDEVKKRNFTKPPIQRQGSQLLTMTTLNKMLQWQEKPSVEQRRQVTNLTKQIEVAKFKTKLLAHEKDKKAAHIRQLVTNYTAAVDESDDRGHHLMENYRILSRDSEKLKDWYTKLIQLKELQLHTNAQLQHRRQQLMSQLLFMYPINQLSPQKQLIGGIYLPNSDMLHDCSEDGLAVALGYVSHILLMCSSFLQVPLRYNVTYFGSRSYITDHINAALSDRDRE
uniref:UV radiation resistance-associated gene protein n=1 Tax=Photinus pyralis TaxID=7054 RepID=A0A1Y1KER1_PHOPY